MQYAELTGFAVPVATATIVAILFQALKVYAERLPGCRPGQVSHDNALRLLVWVLNALALAGLTMLTRRLYPEDVAPIIFTALLMMTGSAGGYAVFKGGMGSGSNASDDGSTLSAYPPEVPEEELIGLLGPAHPADMPTVMLPAVQPAVQPAQPAPTSVDEPVPAGAQS
jgi:hypothetical protein